jgi:hypothetical protein
MAASPIFLTIELKGFKLLLSVVDGEADEVVATCVIVYGPSTVTGV